MFSEVAEIMQVEQKKKVEQRSVQFVKFLQLLKTSDINH